MSLGNGGAGDGRLIQVQDITRVFTVGGEEVRALRGITFSISRGEWVAIIGQSGSGKSTLMNVLGCLDTPTSGRYMLNNKDVSRMSDDELATVRNVEIGFIFQTFQLLPKETALANVELPLVYGGVGRRERRRRAVAALAAVGLDDRLEHLPSQLSGGQQQRVALARALVTSPDVVLADEPTGNLDSKSESEVLGMLQDVNARGATLVIVTHAREVAERSTRIVHMLDGCIDLDEALGSEAGVLAR